MSRLEFGYGSETFHHRPDRGLKLRASVSPMSAHCVPHSRGGLHLFDDMQRSSDGLSREYFCFPARKRDNIEVGFLGLGAECRVVNQFIESATQCIQAHVR